MFQKLPSIYMDLKVAVIDNPPTHCKHCKHSTCKHCKKFSGLNLKTVAVVNTQYSILANIAKSSHHRFEFEDCGCSQYSHQGKQCSRHHKSGDSRAFIAQVNSLIMCFSYNLTYIHVTIVTYTILHSHFLINGYQSNFFFANSFFGMQKESW